MRFDALKIAIDRKPIEIKMPEEKVSQYFATNTFDKNTMRKFLSKDTFIKFTNALSKGGKIEREIITQMADALKLWALEKGATHYTHWFQPLTGVTAEKHDSFLDFFDAEIPIENFTGNQLVQQEPDASSFPSGGIRNTFEARGYTAWDPSSPPFIINQTLCIPTIFIAYTGESLDFKLPLIRACNNLDKIATEVCHYFDEDITNVMVTLGWEQEYFLVDSALYNARPDLMLTGRTLFGHASARDQQLEDNYFGVIPERVLNFMRELELEAHKLGIPLKTRHNEVSPNQFECAPIFEEVNTAVDHNQMLMDLMEKIAKKHNFTVLLHEKPYAGINGSGKHNNWSLMTNTGENLLSPGKSQKNNFRFIVFLANILKAVHEYNGLLRACIASAGNDLRLGANEAPPAIISAYIGSYLTKLLDNIDAVVENGILNETANRDLIISIQKIPEILLDNTDRNRTSPFAFTGNKFEFRAVGSTANCSSAMIVLNTIMANQLMQFKNEVDGYIQKHFSKEDALLKVIKRYIKESKPIRFEGNNYAAEWVEEADKRGLRNIPATPLALACFVEDKTVNLFEELQILTKRELHARYEIWLENYTKKVQIESRVMGDLAINHIVPIAIKYQNLLIENVKGLKEILDVVSYRKVTDNPIKTIREISEHVHAITQDVELMIEERKKANVLTDAKEKAMAYYQFVLPYFEKIRGRVDKLELIVDDKLWPLPKYRELLFIK